MQSTIHASLASDLINAQQARRALDYLVGFNLSPLLWKKNQAGIISRSRTESRPKRLICEREDEIEKFVAKEYWTIEADCKKQKQAFLAKLTRYQKNKLDQFDINSEKLAQAAHKVSK